MERRIDLRRAAAGLALCSALAGCVAEPPPPVCGQPGVLERVGDILLRQGRTVVFDAPPVGEVSPPPARAGDPLVRCAVRAHTVRYDTNRYGTLPIYDSFTVGYTIEQRPNGLFVRVD